MRWFALFVLVPAIAHADDAAAYQKAVGAVVGIIHTMPDGKVYRGTGVVVSLLEYTLEGREIHGGTVVTAEHVVAGGGKIEVIAPERDNRGLVIGNPAYYIGRTIDGVSFSFAFSSGELTPETLLAAIEKIRSKLKELQKSESRDVAALAELLRAS
jgi:hypothetical protein